MSEEWRKHKELLATALELDPAVRHRFLVDSGLEPSVIEELETLLNLQSDAADFLSVPAGGFAGDFFAGGESVSGDAQGRFGPYEIIGELGTGGMGSVYLAERRDGKFAHKVAIKLLRREFNTAAIRRNFEREKSILVELRHPNIVSLIDTGETDDGLPYLVMEYVDGLPFDEYCFSNNLTIGARLKLFNKICESVSFAHRNLIVHRDLKPSNILVTKDGIPKLLDFGISKILGNGNFEKGRSTTLIGAMTPEYASPEQINGKSVTTATDVYSLGIVLYRILTGTHPFKRDGQENVELLNAISNDEPTAPSAAVSLDRAGSRIENPRLLRGDLDNIVLKAIRKNPERRYHSVEHLAADIWRYIDGQPVEARPATIAYRAGKLLKRNKIAAAASALIAAVLIIGISVSLWQARVARANAAAAAIESENAKTEQRKSEKISRFMTKIISFANPRWYAEGHRGKGEARVIDALNEMESRIESEFANEPEVLAELHHQFGEVYFTRMEAGGIVKAHEHFLRALELRRAYYGDSHELVAKDMAYVYWSSPQPKTEESVKMFSDAIIMMRAANPRNPNLPFMLEDYFHRLSGDKYADRHELYLRYAPPPVPSDKYLAAEQLFDEMLAILRQQYDENSDPVINQKCAGMLLKRRNGRLADAESYHQACVSAVEALRSKGESNPRWETQIREFGR